MLAFPHAVPASCRSLKMQPHRRREEILRLVRVRGDCSIAELALALGVSDETIRRNVKPLVQQGLVEKVHGGVVLSGAIGEPPFQRRMQKQVREKEAVAELVAGLVSSGDSIIMDTGSTNAYVARALRRHDGLTVVTNCTEIARTLAPIPGNRVLITGGELRADDSAAFGTASVEFVSQFHVGYAILSIGAITDAGEFMDFHLAEAEFSRAAIRQAATTVVAADHSKFGARAFVKVCDTGMIDILVSDRMPSAPLHDRLRDAGTRVVTPASPL